MKSKELQELIPFIFENYYLRKFPNEEQESKVPIKELLDRLEIALIKLALVICSFNQAEAARSLGLNRTTLVMKLKKYKINKEQCIKFYTNTRRRYEDLLGNK